MEQEKKGCVYFFRHIGLTPVKIGYSSHESPIKRFEQKNEFQIAYAKYVDKRNHYKSIKNSITKEDEVFSDENNSIIMPIILDKKAEIINILKNDKDVKVSELSKKIELSRKTIYQYINKSGVKNLSPQK